MSETADRKKFTHRDLTPELTIAVRQQSRPRIWVIATMAVLVVTASASIADTHAATSIRVPAIRHPVMVSVVAGDHGIGQWNGTQKR